MPPLNPDQIDAFCRRVEDHARRIESLEENLNAFVRQQGEVMAVLNRIAHWLEQLFETTNPPDDHSH